MDRCRIDLNKLAKTVLVQMYSGHDRVTTGIYGEHIDEQLVLSGRNYQISRSLAGEKGRCSYTKCGISFNKAPWVPKRVNAQFPHNTELSSSQPIDLQ